MSCLVGTVLRRLSRDNKTTPNFATSKPHPLTTQHLALNTLFGNRSNLRALLKLISISPSSSSLKARASSGRKPIPGSRKGGVGVPIFLIVLVFGCLREVVWPFHLAKTIGACYSKLVPNPSHGTDCSGIDRLVAS